MWTWPERGRWMTHASWYDALEKDGTSRGKSIAWVKDRTRSDEADQVEVVTLSVRRGFWGGTLKLWSKCQSWREALQAAGTAMSKDSRQRKRANIWRAVGVKWGSERQESPYYMGLCGPMLGEKFGDSSLDFFYCKIHTTKFTVLIFFSAQFDVMKCVHNVKCNYHHHLSPELFFIL